MGTVPISVIMGFDYPLDPYQVEMVGDAFDFMKKKKGDDSEKQTCNIKLMNEHGCHLFHERPVMADNALTYNGLQWQLLRVSELRIGEN